MFTNLNKYYIFFLNQDGGSLNSEGKRNALPFTRPVGNDVREAFLQEWTLTR